MSEVKLERSNIEPRQGTAWTDPQTQIELVWIPPGSFMMGSDSAEHGRHDDEVLHRVTLTGGFWLGKYLVTQAQWKAMMGKNPSLFKPGRNPAFLNWDDHPVEQVSWDDAREFIRGLNTKSGGEHYRLPTEAEWEYACRAGTQTAYYWGGEIEVDGEYCWSATNSLGTPHPVGQRRPNGWGLYDMLGNVSEWCADWYDAYPMGDVADPSGPLSGAGRVYRGGGWRLGDRACRSACRNSNLPGYHEFDLGFRLARTAS